MKWQSEIKRERGGAAPLPSVFMIADSSMIGFQEACERINYSYILFVKLNYYPIPFRSAFFSFSWRFLFKFSIDFPFLLILVYLQSSKVLSVGRKNLNNFKENLELRPSLRKGNYGEELCPSYLGADPLLAFPQSKIAKLIALLFF